jgi:hypothetical protein
MVEIRNRWTDEAICTGETIRDAVLGNLNRLRGANLRGANLRGADLGGADLRGAYLVGADLRGADLNWQSHDLLAEILRQAAGEETEKLKVAGLVIICRGKCWDWFASLSSDPLYGWAIAVLASYVREGDGCPGVLQNRVKAGV